MTPAPFREPREVPMHPISSPLATDLYQLTMMQGYFHSELRHHEALFDLFFRTPPFGGGYAVYAGLSHALSYLEQMRFSGEDLEYLRSLRLFQEDFLDYLAEFRFQGRIYSIPEGSLVFPHEPLLRVEGNILQCQLLETALLNLINFPTLIATKAARISREAGEDNVLEFGFRRAQGPDGGLTASWASYLGGCAGTSNVWAGEVYGIPVKGTHAHSWVMAFPDELTAFRRYGELYPRSTILLVDTYDTLRSGVPNAIRVGLEMKERGDSLYGIRLDSGDLAYLSMEARRMLDEAGLASVKIVASNELDEHVIDALNQEGHAIDLYGVGTKLVTAADDPSLSGVYKLAGIRPPGGEWVRTLKISEGRRKSTLPGRKQIYRLRNGEGEMIADLLELEESHPDFRAGVWGVHHELDHRRKHYTDIAEAEPLLRPVMKEGKVLAASPSLEELRKRVRESMSSLHHSHLRLLNPHIYKVSLGPALTHLTLRLREEYTRRWEMERETPQG